MRGQHRHVGSSGTRTSRSGATDSGTAPVCAPAMHAAPRAPDVVLPGAFSNVFRVASRCPMGHWRSPVRPIQSQSLLAAGGTAVRYRTWHSLQYATQYCAPFLVSALRASTHEAPPRLQPGHAAGHSCAVGAAVGTRRSAATVYNCESLDRRTLRMTRGSWHCARGGCAQHRASRSHRQGLAPRPSRR